ncbi:MAG: hypothetical protein AAGU74_12950 [Bacillota bacterium]
MNKAKASAAPSAEAMKSGVRQREHSIEPKKDETSENVLFSEVFVSMSAKRMRACF